MSLSGERYPLSVCLSLASRFRALAHYPSKSADTGAGLVLLRALQGGLIIPGYLIIVKDGKIGRRRESREIFWPPNHRAKPSICSHAVQVSSCLSLL